MSSSVAKFFILGSVAVVVAVGFGILAALTVMLLWNALLPDLFDFPEIGFWQALGLSVLSTLLFKSSGSSSESCPHLWSHPKPREDFVARSHCVIPVTTKPKNHRSSGTLMVNSTEV